MCIRDRSGSDAAAPRQSTRGGHGVRAEEGHPAGAVREAGRGHADHLADLLRLPDRPPPGAGRHRHDPRRGQPGHDNARLRQHPAGDDGGHDPPHRGGAPRGAHRLARRRHAVHELPAERGVRDPERRSLHGRGRLRRRQARGRRGDGRPRRRDRPGGDPGHRSPWPDPAERQRAGRLPAPRQGRRAGEEDRRRRAGARGSRGVLHPPRACARPPLPAHHRARETLHRHGPGLGARRPRPAAHLPRRVRALPEVHPAHGQGLRRRRGGDPRGPGGLRRRGDRADLPAARELVRDEGRGIRRAREAAGMSGRARDVSADLRGRLAIPADRLDELNAFLLDPGSRVVNDLLAVIAHYGTPEEINRKARAAGELPALLDRVRTAHPAYLADLEWLAGERDRGAFVSVPDFRRGVVGARADTTAFRDDMAVTLEVSALQYFPWVIAVARKAITERSLMPARWIQVRRMKEQEVDGDLPAIAAAMHIIGASYVETLDTKGTDGSNIHLGGPATITGYFGGIGEPNDHALQWLDEFLHYYTEYGVRQVLNVNPGTVLAGYLLHRLGVDIEFK